jgi:hypothetical protein
VALFFIILSPLGIVLIGFFKTFIIFRYRLSCYSIYPR